MLPQFSETKTTLPVKGHAVTRHLLKPGDSATAGSLHSMLGCESALNSGL